ncbi:hypothetical protein DCC62_20930 [candidate division KSB1 bacterium]|nr:MAG: hypothetical protein DCC62_20930 [candidate division KSB1 bacterium]
MTPEEQGAVKLDLNNPVFQKHLFALSKEEQGTVLRTLRKLSQMTWNQVYQDRGLKWELVYSRTGPSGARLYSFRLGKGFRGIAYRDGSWMRILSLHPDHDSTYS